MSPWAGYLFILLLLLPVTSIALEPVELTIRETGAVPWRVTGILPGDHGSTFTDLHNNGTENGIVYIWVDNITVTDRFGNPGGGLDKYMFLGVLHRQINSTVILPARINSFPPAPLLPGHFIVIEPFNAGDTIRLNWTWEFKETGQPQNDAQNNSLHFNISYTLVNLTAPTEPTPVPTAVPTGITTGGPFVGGPQGPALYEGGKIPGFNPGQRPQLRAPSEEIPDEEQRAPGKPDHRYIMILAFIMLALAVTVHLHYKKHPAWQGPAAVLLGIGIALTIIGVLYQSYLISISEGQHLNGIHTLLGVSSLIFIIPVLMLWNRKTPRNESQDSGVVWFIVLWAVTAIVCMVLGIRSAGML